MNRIISRISLLCVALMWLSASPAHAHVTANKEGNRWYLDGQTYGDDQAQRISDPVDMLFFRGTTPAATFFANAANINDAFAQHWTGPGRMSSTAKCTKFSGDQFMKFRSFRSRNGADRTIVRNRDFQQLNGSSVSFRSCSDEYHIRWWLDDSHASIAQGNDAHGSTGQWSIGAAHHEDRGTFNGHHIDQPWDQVRDSVLRNMRYYCSRRHFKYHAGSYGPFQGYSHDGYIAALSLKPRSNSC